MLADIADATKTAASASQWDHEVDLLVFGSGAGGLSAALFGEINGLKTLLCEKDAQLGGTTASSGGIVWAPGNTHARRAGVDDPIEQARLYLKSEQGNHYRSDLADAFLESAGEAIDMLEQQSDVKFRFLPWPDYHTNLPGGAESGRILEALPFDGRRLGARFGLVRAPYKPLMLLGGMQVDKRKVDDFLNPFRSVSTFLRVVRTFARYGVDRLSYQRGTEIGAGNALVARFVASLLARNAQIWTGAPLVELIVENGRALGAVILREGKRIRVRARRGVVLATGGFPNSRTLREELSADFPYEFSFGFEGNVGDGILAARSAGAVMDSNLASTAYWQPSSSRTTSDGKREGVMYGYLDRGRPGVIAVDQSGKRFVNEANSYHDVGLALHENGSARGAKHFFVCDRDFVWHHGLGMIRPFRPSLKRFLDMGYIVAADTVADLARKIGVDPDGLVATVRRHNEFAQSGVDADFGKGSTSYNRLFAHPRAKPNGNLAPIQTAPFIALQIYPGALGSAVGLDVDADARVLGRDGRPIEGLFACGNDMASVMRGTYPSGGITLGPAIAFGYRAARRAAVS